MPWAVALPHPAPTRVVPASIYQMPRRRRSRKWHWIAAFLILLLSALFVSLRIVILRAEPILRSRVIETLSARFKSRVELAGLRVWIADGLHVEGKGLQIFGATDPNPWKPGIQPLLEVGEFRFQTSLRNLFREPMRVDTIYVNGLVMNIPPPNDRREINNFRRHSAKMKIAVNHFVCANAKLIINTSKPGKPPLEFDISDLRMKELGPGLPLQFDATLRNPKPVGQIKSTGRFGPLDESSPRDSAVEGEYSFTNADLGTLKGIGGTLSSRGRYRGSLGRIVVDGATDTPNFSIARCGRSVPLHTDFHAIVDGTDGDTYLEPVAAQLLHSSFTARGKVVRIQGRGHDIELDVTIPRARIEDLLAVGVKTEPPVLAGPVSMRTRLSIRPGKEDIVSRLALAGKFRIPEALFSNEKTQQRIDSLSLRSQGKPKLAKSNNLLKVTSDMTGTFTLSDGVLDFSSLHFQIPGTQADLTGQYSLDGDLFDFHGVLKLEAKLSQMNTGWKSILLKPVDPFFHKDGAGTELPFKVTGTREAPQFGLDFHHKKQDHPRLEEKATR